MAFLELVETIAVVKFIHVSNKHKGDVTLIFNQLIEDGLDKETLGFWVWDLENNIELYSPEFRKSLGYEGEHDFPSVPESWQKAITEKSLNEALANFQHHVDTKGAHNYTQIVTYNKKQGGTVTLDCHGAVVRWDEEKPVLMIGVHLCPE